MAPPPDQVESPPVGGSNENNSTVKTNPQKRIRWATHKASAQQGRKKRQSILDRLHKRTPSDKSTNSFASESDPSQDIDLGGDNDSQSGRTLYFNQPLPPEAKDEEGRPIAQFARNKIRTAKYTALSFVPKNLWFQFHNIANIYFLFIVLLSVCNLEISRLSLVLIQHVYRSLVCSVFRILP